MTTEIFTITHKPTEMQIFLAIRIRKSVACIPYSQSLHMQTKSSVSPYIEKVVKRTKIYDRNILITVKHV